MWEHAGAMSISGEPRRQRALGLARRYLPELIYGSNDGIITTFAIVSGVVGAQLANEVILILGLASLFADGFSMAASDFLSERSKPDEVISRGQAAKRASATFIGFVALGVTPLLAYLLPLSPGARFSAAATITLVVLFLIGAARAIAAERIQWLRGGLEMLAVGAIAAAVAYFVGILISGLTGGAA